MNKHFQLHRGCRCDLFQFFQRYLTLQNDPLYPQFFQQFYSGRIVNVHLGGGMDCQVGKISPDNVQHAELLYDHSIHRQSGDLA